MRSRISLIIGLLFISNIILSSSCNWGKGTYLTDSDIVVYDRLFSPDGKKVILNYVYDIGALGYTRMFSSVMNVEDTLSDLSINLLPEEYIHPRWIDNNSIEVIVDIRSYIVKKQQFIQKTHVINGIKIHVKSKDFGTDRPLFVEHRALSPDKTRELVAYRYRDRMEAGNLHVSVIDEGAELPAIGNIYIGNEYDDYIQWGEWISNDTIALYATPFNVYFAKYFILENNLNINVVLQEQMHTV
jgi:hypothetical protein